MKLLRSLINTNLFISLAAVLFTIESQIQLGFKPALRPYLFIIFFATLFEYNLHRLITLAYHPEALSSPKHKWLRENKRSFYILVLFSIAGFISSLFFAKIKVLAALLPIAAITLLYTMPIFRIREKLMRLREIPGMKIFMIAFVWSAITVLLPVIQPDTDSDPLHVILMILERCFFIFAITIPFDIRDMEADSKAGIKTLPLIHGEQKSLSFANLAMWTFIVMSGAHYACMQMFPVAIACVVSGLITLFCLNNRRLRAFELYHYAVLDGCISVQGLLIISSYFFCQPS